MRCDRASRRSLAPRSPSSRSIRTPRCRRSTIAGASCTRRSKIHLRSAEDLPRAPHRAAQVATIVDLLGDPGGGAEGAAREASSRSCRESRARPTSRSTSPPIPGRVQKRCRVAGIMLVAARRLRACRDRRSGARRSHRRHRARHEPEAGRHAGARRVHRPRAARARRARRGARRPRSRPRSASVWSCSRSSSTSAACRCCSPSVRRRCSGSCSRSRWRARHDRVPQREYRVPRSRSSSGERHQRADRPARALRRGATARGQYRRCARERDEGDPARDLHRDRRGRDRATAACSSPAGSGLNQFGLVGCAGMLLVWLVTFTLVPPLVLSGERLREGAR